MDEECARLIDPLVSIGNSFLEDPTTYRFDQRDYRALVHLSCAIQRLYSRYKRASDRCRELWDRVRAADEEITELRQQNEDLLQSGEEMERALVLAKRRILSLETSAYAKEST